MSCDPPKSLGVYDGVVNINAKIVNPRDSIGINDTIRIQLEVPDTLIYNGQPTPVFFGNNDGANCGIRLNKIDTINAGSIGPATGSITLASIGYLNPNKAIFFKQVGNRLKAEYLYLPKTKGVFFLEQQQDGSLDASNRQYKFSFKFNFGNINHNHQMLIDSAGPAAHFNLYLQGHIVNGWEIYGFKVN